MAKADQLRVEEVRDAYRLLGECRDLGSDPELWQPRMFAALSRMFGDVPVTGGEGRISTTDGTMLPLSSYDAGHDAEDHRNYLAYVHANGPTIDPFVRAMQRIPFGAITSVRSQIVTDREYYRSPIVERYLRPGHVHHRLASVVPTSHGGAISLIHLHRRRGQRDFSSRERALLAFFHGELAPLVGRALVSATEPAPSGLPRRLRQTLACLVEGDSEKQVAARLGLSHATVHQYVTMLYRRFGVGSRGQLLAHVVRRMARPEWRDDLIV